MQFLKERINKIASELNRLTISQEIKLTGFKMNKTKQRHSDIGKLDTTDWKDFGQGSIWGGDKEYFWFDGTIKVPPSMDGKCVFFKLATGREGRWDLINPQFAFYINGKLCQGLDVNHGLVLLDECAKANESVRITLSAFTGDNNHSLLFDASLIEVDRRTQELFYDINVPLKTAELLGEEHSEYINIISTLNNTINLLDLRCEYSKEYYESLEAAHKYLSDNLYSKGGTNDVPQVSCVGHTHIDVAWLWTLDVTKDKSVRSFSTVLKLMDEYPEYKFMSSQPQLYKYVKKNEPELYERIRERIKEGRWEPEGAMFVEADCNLASGESLVRQILYGKRFFMSEFGSDNVVLWLPDVFGYSAALPQIMKKSGIKYFMTTKISWNEYNKIPYDTFDWIGIDGTKVLTHFIPATEYKNRYQTLNPNVGHYTTYNGVLNPSQVMGGWQRYQQKDINRDVLMAFGYGDGGGGATREMLENQRRLSKGIPGAPKTRMSGVREFFEKLAGDVHESGKLPEWTGELYLEYHRGTYTTMARNKKLNRRAEFAIQNAEWLSSLNCTLNGALYPEYILKDVWEKLMRNQFHDILPGSSIKEVYEDSLKEYKSLKSSTDTVIDQAMGEIAAGISPYCEEEQTLVVFNPNGFETSGMVEFDAQGEVENPVVISGDSELACQKTDDGKYISYLDSLPSKGYKSFAVREKKKNLLTDALSAIRQDKTKACLEVTKELLENDFFIIRIDENGRFASIYDKRECRELIPDGQNANLLMSYEDKPHNWDAWDINSYYIEKSWPVNEILDIKVKETGPLRGCLEISYKYLESVIKLSIFIYKDMPQIDIKYEIDWREKQILLKALFPVDVNSHKADFDIQYGNVSRPTHKNTSWDKARFEVCMHKWMDISEDGYGLSILNDSKYGCSVDKNVIGITLLKSPIYPNPDADKEKHEFVLSIMPHKGGWRDAATVQKAYLLNNPLIAKTACELPKLHVHSKMLEKEFSFVKCDMENIIIESIKRAEDSEDWIIRMYECYNRRTNANIKFGWNIQKVATCDIMENEINNIAICNDETKITFKPYEIVTLRVH